MFALLALLAAQEIAAPKPDPCADYIGLGYTIVYQPAAPRQGETLELIPMFVKFHGMPLMPVPLNCASDWKIEGEGVKCKRDGRLIIADKAVPGTEIQFSAQLGGKEGGRGYGGFKIISAAQKVLSGKFRVVSQQGCHTPKIAEMGFSAGGRYSYTLPEHMVETMVSGSGTYRSDGATGKIELGSADEPFKALQTGTAKWVDGSLVLEGLDPAGSSVSCRITLAGG